MSQDNTVRNALIAGAAAGALYLFMTSGKESYAKTPLHTNAAYYNRSANVDLAPKDNPHQPDNSQPIEDHVYNPYHEPKSDFTKGRNGDQCFVPVHNDEKTRYDALNAGDITLAVAMKNQVHPRHG